MKKLFFIVLLLSFYLPGGHSDDCSTLLKKFVSRGQDAGGLIEFTFKEIWHKAISPKAMHNMKQAKLWNTSKGKFTQIPTEKGFHIIEHGTSGENSVFQYFVRAISRAQRLTLEQRLKNLVKEMVDPDYLNVFSGSLINQDKMGLFENMGIILETTGDPVVATSKDDLYLWQIRADWKLASKVNGEIVGRNGRTGISVEHYMVEANLPDYKVFIPTKDYVKQNKNSFNFYDLTKYEHQLGIHKREHEFAAALLENKDVNSPEEILDMTNPNSWNEVAFLGGPAIDNPRPAAIFVKIYGDDRSGEQYTIAKQVAQELDIPLVVINEAVKSPW